VIGYKLFRKRKDGTYGPLFINKRQVLRVGTQYPSESHFTKGYAFRPGWHICATPNAPHLKTEGRVWCRVEFNLAEELHRPESQGGLWYLGNTMTILEELTSDN
jgi:hypothetical protein